MVEMVHAIIRRALTNAAVACIPGAQRGIASTRGIAITFDDGPHPVATVRALDALGRCGLRATFFVLTDNARRYPGLLERCIGEGHEVALHGCTHRGMALAGRRRLRAMLDEGQREIGALCGRQPTAFRPPYGRWNPAHNNLLKALGMRLVLWNRSPAEYLPSMRHDHVTAYIRSALRPGDILLLHDNDTTAAGIGRIVGDLAAVLVQRGLEALPLQTPVPVEMPERSPERGRQS